MLTLPNRRTVWAFLSGAFTTLILTGSQWFPDFWSLFSNKPFFLWLKEQWPDMTTAVYLYLKLLVYVVALGLLCMMLRAIYQQKKEYGWLEAIADEDDRDIENRIQVFHWDEIGHGPATNPHLYGHEPYIDLKATIRNNTVYTLTITHVEGALTLEKSHPYHDPKIVNSSKEIKHVQPYKLKLRQHIHPDSAEQIMKDGAVTIKGGNAAVCCTYKNRAGEQKSIHIPLNDLRFKVQVLPG